jgi:hypothetical protein
MPTSLNTVATVSNIKMFVFINQCTSGAIKEARSCSNAIVTELINAAGFVNYCSNP